MRVAASMQRAATVAGLSRDTRNPVDTCTDYLLVQGADRLWSTQDMGWLVPSVAIPFDMGGQFAADLGYGMAGPGGRGTGTPYACLTPSGMATGQPATGGGGRSASSSTWGSRVAGMAASGGSRNQCSAMRATGSAERSIPSRWTAGCHSE